MAGYFFVTGMTVIEFPDGIQWNKRAKPTFTGACAGLFPVMIDNFPAPPDMPIWDKTRIKNLPWNRNLNRNPNWGRMASLR